MRSWPVRLAVTILSLLLLLCFLLPFRTVSLGMDTTLSIPGFAMLMGFAFSADGSGIAVPAQIFYLIAAAGALMLFAWSVRNLLPAGRRRFEGVGALAGLVTVAGFLGQSLLEPGAYAANAALPKVVRTMFGNPLEPAAAAAGMLGFVLFAFALAQYLASSPSGMRIWKAFTDRKLAFGMAVLAAVALFLLVTPLKMVDLGKGERIVVYGYSLLFGTTVSNGGETAAIPPQPFLLGFALLASLTIALAFVRLPRKLLWLAIAVPVMAGACVFAQILYEMFVYNLDKALPDFVRQVLSGKYELRVFMAIGAVFVAAAIGVFALVIEFNKNLSRRLQDYTTLYLFMLPGILLFFLFNYLPMFGVVMAFQQYDPVAGFFKSQWVGLQNFIDIFKLPAFLQAMKNTLLIAAIRLIVEFPMPIIFALMLNELRHYRFKRVVQSISYLPNFISWVIVAGIWYQILSPDSGIVNQAIMSLGLAQESVYFMQSKAWFYPIIIFTSIWKSLGFSSILYMASIAGIDQEQYEAAKVDGAGRWRQMVHITLPGMKSTIVLLFILAIAGLLSAGGFEQMWTMGNAAVRDISEILDTLVLRYLTRGNFRDLSSGAAMGMFKSVVGLILFFTANLVSKKLSQESLI